MTVLLCYCHLPVSALYVTHGDEFRAIYCVDMRLDIGHRPCLSNEEFINSSPVIDAETWSAIRFRDNAYRRSPCTRALLDNANRLHALSTFINHFLCSWIGPIRVMIHWLSVFSVTGILLQRYYIFPVISRLVKKLTDTEDTGPVVVFSADR